MSTVREDLETILADTENKGFTPSEMRALDRLHAALTPSAEVWLAALPGLMESGNALPCGEWAVGRLFVDGPYEVVMPEVGGGRTILRTKEAAQFVVALRNALHSAAQAQEK